MTRLPPCLLQLLVGILMLIILPACNAEPLPTQRRVSPPPYAPSPAPSYNPPPVFRPPAVSADASQAGDVSARIHSRSDKRPSPVRVVAPRRETRDQPVVRRPSPSVARTSRSYGAPRCRTGKPCGNSCISASKTCRK